MSTPSAAVCLIPPSLNPPRRFLVTKFPLPQAADSDSSTGSPDTPLVDHTPLVDLLVDLPPGPKPGERALVVRVAENNAENNAEGNAGAEVQAAPGWAARVQAADAYARAKLPLPRSAVSPPSPPPAAAAAKGGPAPSKRLLRMADCIVRNLPFDHSFGSDGDDDDDDDDAGSPPPQDGSDDECALCGGAGTLLCCDTCPHSFHAKCLVERELATVEEVEGDGAWSCMDCVNHPGENERLSAKLLPASALLSLLPLDSHSLASGALDAKPGFDFVLSFPDEPAEDAAAPSSPKKPSSPARAPPPPPFQPPSEEECCARAFYSVVLPELLCNRGWLETSTGGLLSPSDPDCPRHPRACYANIGEFIEAGEMPVDLAGRYEAIKRLVRLGGAREKKRGKKGAAAAASASLFGSPGKKRKGGEEEKGEEGEGEKPAWQKVSRVGADYQVPELPAAGGGFLSDSPDERAENEQVWDPARAEAGEDGGEEAFQLLSETPSRHQEKVMCCIHDCEYDVGKARRLLQAAPPPPQAAAETPAEADAGDAEEGEFWDAKERARFHALIMEHDKDLRKLDPDPETLKWSCFKCFADKISTCVEAMGAAQDEPPAQEEGAGKAAEGGAGVEAKRAAMDDLVKYAKKSRIAVWD
ncbi:hypothetical protein TeGR_g10316 [Tetraparma gracilis]|uniref:PHD-type domain-containing protein n=1 Tax=Tetraparma gracilis TaxID=2962635 RepID=A0ABQ6N0A1_9STRA|nr:hypothetical protein TeGR_g10316 [Tetraparma gracilis]